MDIRMLSLKEGAKHARGVAVIIDVFRAFSTACYAFEAGASCIYPVGDIDTAYRLQRAHPDYVLMGERGGRTPEGFDYQNSPSVVRNADLRGKTVIHTTSAGTRGIASATGADTIITGSFVNADAIIRYLREKNPPHVSLVAMGDGGKQSAEEDDLCADYIHNGLEGRQSDFAKMYSYLKECRSSQRFFDPSNETAPREDFELCLSLNRFSFVLKVECEEEGCRYLRRIDT